jgi:hypothetical protein
MNKSKPKPETKKVNPSTNSVSQRAIMPASAEELSTALKSCNELGEAMNLEQFIIDLQKIPGSRTPNPDSVTLIKSDPILRKFLRSVVVCTE